jgi:hypothetical protein
MPTDPPYDALLAAPADPAERARAARYAPIVWICASRFAAGGRLHTV